MPRPPGDGGADPAEETPAPHELSVTDDDGVLDADALLVAGQDPPSVRVPLSRERVAAAAVAFIDERGLPGLTMRALGELLDVEAMSLYRHVADKESLLDAVVEMTIGEMSTDPDVGRAPTDGWQHFLQHLAHGIRRVALRHPNVFPLVASRPPEAPWLRPPLRSLDWVEAFLAGMASEGFPDAAAVAAYRAFSSFLLGHLLLEVSSLGADVGPLDVLEDRGTVKGELAAYPTVRHLRGALAEDHAAREFEESLESLLERIALLRTTTVAEGR